MRLNTQPSHETIDISVIEGALNDHGVMLKQPIKEVGHNVHGALISLDCMPSKKGKAGRSKGRRERNKKKRRTERAERKQRKQKN